MTKERRCLLLGTLYLYVAIVLMVCGWICNILMMWRGDLDIAGTALLVFFVSWLSNRESIRYLEKSYSPGVPDSES